MKLTLLTFAYINFIMIIFRSSDLKTAGVFIRGILCHPWSWQPYYSIYAMMVAFLIGMHIYRGVFMSGRQGVRMSPPVRGAFWFVMIMLIVYGAVERSEKFIYFQF